MAVVLLDQLAAKGERVTGTVHASTMPATNCNRDCCRRSVSQDELPSHLRTANAKVVGSGLATHGPNDHRHLPGTDLTYRNVFFGATREYGPDEGWQVVSYKKKKRRYRVYEKKKEEEQAELEVTEEDEY